MREPVWRRGAVQMGDDRPHFSSGKPSECPVCGSTRVVEIAYGYPGPEMFEEARAGDIVLGGCMVSEFDPKWQCRDCETSIYPEELRDQVPPEWHDERPTAILLHGAGVGPWVWERVASETSGPSLALEVGGRVPGATPEGSAARVLADIDAAGAGAVVLVVHSLAGVLVPSLAAKLGDRLRHVVYVSAVVPDAGKAFVDAIGFPAGLILRALFRFNRAGLKPSEAMIRKEACNDLSDADAAEVVARYEAEFPGLYTTPVAEPPAVPTTYVRLTRDQSVLPAKQAAMAARLHAPQVVEIDAGHLVMLSKPEKLAAVIDEVVASSA